MIISDIDKQLAVSTEQYKSAVDSIRQCAAAYELKCADIIEKITNADSLNQAEIYFIELQHIHDNISALYYKYEFDFGKKMNNFIIEFDRMDSDYIKKYWFDKFKAGTSWPGD